MMKITLKRFLVAVTLMGIIGVIVLVSGIVPVRASSGHWPMTAWILDYASDRSIDFHSNGIEVPPLDEPGMVTLGAATYQSNCQFCHGQPGRSQPPITHGMTPTPPSLSDSIPQMNSQEIFYVLKHGVKFAGMPAWPTQSRDDEIWPVVAFLEAFPSMTNRQYLKRTGGLGLDSESDRDASEDASDPLASSANAEMEISNRFVLNRCASCHGMDGNNNVNRRVPVLAGQNAAYLAESLRSYRDKTRYSGVMMPVAYHLTESQINALADHFAHQSRASESSERTDRDDLVKLGKRLATEGDAKRKIPSCVDCHGPRQWLRSSTYPRLAGQPEWYLHRQLELFKEGKRGGAEAEIMHKVADKLDDESRLALAAYYAQARLFNNETSEETRDQ